MKTTKQEVQGMFNRFVKAMQRAGKVGDDKWVLDYVSHYGGYVIEIYNAQGQLQSSPFGYVRRSAREMCLSLCMATSTLELLKSQ